MISLTAKHMELSHTLRPADAEREMRFSWRMKDKVQTAVRWLQVVVAPMCETRAPEHTPHVQETLEQFQRDVLAELHARGGYSEALESVPTTTSAWQDWMDLAEDEMKSMSMLRHTDTHWALLRGELTIWNRIGAAMTYGTTCRCCHGWRIIFAFVVGVAIGFVF